MNLSERIVFCKIHETACGKLQFESSFKKIHKCTVKPLPYFKATFRTLQKNPLFTAINVLELSKGIASAMLIFLYIANELRVDHFHQNAQRIYRITSLQDNSGEINAVATTPPLLDAALRSDIPEITNVT